MLGRIAEIRESKECLHPKKKLTSVAFAVDMYICL